MHCTDQVVIKQVGLYYKVYHSRKYRWPKIRRLKINVIEFTYIRMYKYMYVRKLNLADMLALAMQ